MSDKGNIDEISASIGRLQSSVEAVLDGQKNLAKKTEIMNKSMITTQLNQSALDRRFSKHEDEFKKFTDEEFAQLKKEVENRLKPLEGLRRNILWVWGVIGAAGAMVFSSAIGKLMGKF